MAHKHDDHKKENEKILYQEAFICHILAAIVFKSL